MRHLNVFFYIRNCKYNKIKSRDVFLDLLTMYNKSKIKICVKKAIVKLANKVNCRAILTIVKNMVSNRKYKVSLNEKSKLAQ